jgi:hypothetical protein
MIKYVLVKRTYQPNENGSQKRPKQADMAGANEPEIYFRKRPAVYAPMPKNMACPKESILRPNIIEAESEQGR